MSQLAPNTQKWNVFKKASHGDVARTIRSWIAYGWGPLVALCTAPILARSLGAENRGALAAVLQPMTVADAVAAAGLPAAMTFFVARGAAPRSALKRAVVIYGPLGLVTASVLVVWAIYLDGRRILPLHYSILPWVLVVPFGAYIASRRGIWQGLGRYRPLDAERFISPSVRLILIVGLSFVAISTAGPYVLVYVAASLIAAVPLFKRFPSVSSGSVPTGRGVVTYSARAAVGTIAIALNNRLDQGVLPALISLRDLGAYSVAVAVAEVPAIFTLVLARNVLSESARGVARAGVQRTVTIGFLGVLGCCLGIALATPTFVPLIFGADFSHAVRPTLILLIGSVLSTAGVAATSFISGRGRPGLASVAHGAGAASTIVLYVALGSTMTLELACWVSVASQLLVAMVSVFTLLVYRKSAAGGSRFV